MTQGTAESRAYQRGYNSARRRASDRVKAVIAVAKKYRELSRRPEDRSCCARCARWTRGAAGTVWGTCGASFEYELEPRMWAETKDYRSSVRPKDLQILTTEDFSCPNWLPPEPSP